MARPRSDEARRKVFAAATDLIIERGAASVSIEEVAARSGVAKTTIYRHWPERTSLIIDTLRSTFEHVGVPDTGSLRGDLSSYFNGMVRADLTGRVGSLMPCMLDAAARDPEMHRVLDRLAQERTDAVMTVAERAQAMGELPADLDRNVFIGTVVGPIVFRKVVQRQPIDEEYIESCLDVSLAGLTRDLHPTT